jgi:hypothetical protein
MHLSSHWVDFENDRWSIVSDQGVMTGDFQWISSYMMSNGSYRDSMDTYSKSYWDDYKEKGWKIRAATQFSPSWIIVEEDEKFCLRSVHFSSGRYRFKHHMYLGVKGKEGNRPSLIREHDDLLYIGIDKELLVINVENEPYLALSQTLDSYIIDILPMN